MSSRVIAAVPVATNKTIVWFEGGTSRVYTNEDLGFTAQDELGVPEISADRTLLTWSEDKVLAADDLRDKGSDIDVASDEKTRLLKDLSKIRRDASFSQTRLGEAAGIRQSVISRIEGCEISPQINTLIKLLAPLGKTLAIIDLQEKE